MPRRRASEHNGGYPEIDDIRHDLESLKNNVVELTRHVQENGSDRAQVLRQKARRQVSNLRSQSRHQMQEMEERIKEHPAQSMAVAFIAGLAASLLLGRGR